MDEVRENFESHEYCCPITQKLMADPVIAADGYTYEREAITKWLSKHNTSPITKQILENKNFFPNRTLKAAIQKYFYRNQAKYKSDFVEAMKSNDIEAIIHLNKLGIDFNITDENGWTILHHIVYSKDDAKLRFWLQNRFSLDLNKKTISGGYNKNINFCCFPSDLEETIKSNEEKICSVNVNIEKLLSNIKYEVGHDRYSYGGLWQMDSKSTSSLSGSNFDSLQNILQKCKKAKAKSGMPMTESFNNNQLLGAAERGIQVITKSNQELKVYKNTIDKIKNGYNFNPESFTPLHLSTYLSHIEISNLLIETNANIESVDEIGATPLFWAVYKNDFKLVTFLISRGANALAVDKEGNNLLHAAAKYADQAIIDYLFQVEFLFQARNQQGQTPSQRAKSFERFHIASYITKKGEQQLQLIFRNAARQQLPQPVQNFPIFQIPSAAAPQQNTVSPKPSQPLSLHIAPLSVSGQHSANTVRSSQKIPDNSLELSFSRLNIPYEISFGELSVGNKLGQGGYGIVYQGTYQNNMVAIKQLTHQQLTPEDIDEFRREVTVMAQLDSPYVVKFIGACVEAKNYAIVMEYMPAGSLYELLNSHQPLEWSVRYQISIDVGEGLSYLHYRNIIHGDMKSLNILLWTEVADCYRAKISDFGLAKIKLASSVSTLVGGGGAGGSTRWMAPELFEEEAKNTKSSDVFSYGITLWEIGARKVPYNTTRNEAVPILVIQGKREKIFSETPPKMASLIAKCWKQRAEERPLIKEIVKELKKEQQSMYEIRQ